MTSVVVHHQPGGASSFSLGHDGAPDDRFAHKQNAPKQQQSTSPWATDADNKPQQAP